MRKRYGVPLIREVVSLLLLLVPLVCAAAGWAVSIDQRQGLPVLAKAGGAAMKAQYVFFGKNWAWAHQQVQFKINAPYEYSYSGRNSNLKFNLAGKITKSSADILAYEFGFDADANDPEAIGGGISFKFDLDNYGRDFGEPEIFPDNQGWGWGRGDRRIEMRFSRPLPAIFFERGNKGEIRAYFYKGGITAGQKQFSAKLTIGGDIAIGPTLDERFGMQDMSEWPVAEGRPRMAPIDLSFLNETERPAGKHGFIRAAGDKLVFEDGTVGRFWGTNLAAYALFGSSKENIKLHAQRLSQLGFNLVRLHHHDSPWVTPNIFGDRQANDTQNLQTAMFDKLDWWIKCLKDEGIYVWLDLHVQRHLKPGDRIDNFDEIAKGKPVGDLKGFSYVNKSIQSAMKRFNEAYVNHGNNYTGLRYKDDPAIIAMLITNENDVTGHFGNALLPDKNVPKHSAQYMASAEAFASRNGVPKERVWRSWEMGLPKIFLNDLEHQFNAEMIAHLRAQGVKVPLATTSTWGNNPLISLPALTDGDVIDVHAYGDFGQVEKNPMYSNGMIHWIASAQVADKPLTVSEWNAEPFPVPDRHTLPLFIAGTASHQGWDAMMQYAYSQEPLNAPAAPSNWHVANDPAYLAMLPAAALLYRQAHVKEAASTYAFAPGKDLFFNQLIWAPNSAALRTASEKGRLVVVPPQTKELPWLGKRNVPLGAKVFADPNDALVNSGAVEVTSDSGELRHNWEDGYLVINAPQSQAIMGWVGGKKLASANVNFEISTRNAAVAVQSLDGKPIERSEKIMLSFAARAIPRTPGQLPFLVEPVEGRIRISAGKGLKAYVRDAVTDGLRQLPMSYVDGQYLVRLDASIKSNWVLLR